MTMFMKLANGSVSMDQTRQNITEHIQNNLIGDDEVLSGDSEIENIARQMRNGVRAKQREALATFDMQGPISLCIDDVNKGSMSPGVATDLTISLIELQLVPDKQEVVAHANALSSEGRANTLFIEQLKTLEVYGKKEEKL